MQESVFGTVETGNDAYLSFLNELGTYEAYFVIACDAWRWIEFVRRDDQHTARHAMSHVVFIKVDVCVLSND